VTWWNTSEISQHLLYQSFRPQGFQGLMLHLSMDVKDLELSFKPSDKFRWGSAYGGSPDCNNFTVNKPIMLHGVQHFGSQGGSYAVTTKLKISQIVVLSWNNRACTLQKGKDFSYDCFSVQFDWPACLVENNTCKLASLINGPKSWKGLGYVSFGWSGWGSVIQDLSGDDRASKELMNLWPKLSGSIGSFDAPWSRQILDHWSWSRSPQGNVPLEGQRGVEFHGVLFTFRSSPCANNRTSKKVGQFPMLFWLARLWNVPIYYIIYVFKFFLYGAGTTLS